MATENENPRRRGPASRAAATINPEPKNEPIFKFLVDLFEKGFPEKIVLVGAFGSGGRRLGPPLKDIPFKVNAEKPNHEQLVTMSNFLLQLAQEDCEVFNKPMKYAVLAYDLARSSEPYERKFMALRPIGNSQLLAEARGEIDDEEGGVLSTKLLLGLLDSERRDKRYMTELVTNVLSGVVERQDQRIERMETIVEGTWQRQAELMKATQEMLNSAAEQKAKADHLLWKEKKWDFLLEKGVGIVELFAPQLVAKLVTTTTTTSNPALVFMQSVTADQGSVAFGDVIDQETDTCSGGIFTPSQFQALMKIVRSTTPDDATINAFAASITNEQVAKAQQVFSLAQLMPLMSWMQQRAQAAGGTVQ